MNKKLKNEVLDIYNAVDNPTEEILKVKEVSSLDFLKSNVINSVIITLQKVFDTDTKIEIVLNKIIDKIENDEKISMNDLFKFLTILQEYRLDQYNSAIAPFKTGNGSNPLMDDSNNKSDMEKLSKNLTGKELKKLLELTNNLEKIATLADNL